MFISKPFFISTAIHFIFIGLIIFNNNFFIKEETQLLNDANNVIEGIELFDANEFEAMNSKKPDSIFKNISNIPIIKDVSKKKLNIFENEKSLKINKIDELIQKEFFKEDLPEITSIEKKYDKSLEKNSLSPLKEEFNKKYSPKKIVGNEIDSISIDEKVKLKPRAVDRIDDIASIKTENEVVTINKNIVNNTLDKNMTDKKIEKTQSIESTTKINPEGQKNSKINVSSGAIASSFKPSNRPKILNKNSLTKPEVRPSALLLENQSQSVYDDIAENFFEEDNSTSSQNISILEQQLIKIALKKAVERHWDIGILIGASNYEKYVVKVQFMLDKQGNIYGDIEPVKPKKLDGKFAIAFRQASNALLDAQPISLPVKIENAIKITMNFDPLVGLGF